MCACVRVRVGDRGWVGVCVCVCVCVRARAYACICMCVYVRASVCPSVCVCEMLLLDRRVGRSRCPVWLVCYRPFESSSSRAITWGNSQLRIHAHARARTHTQKHTYSRVEPFTSLCVGEFPVKVNWKAFVRSRVTVTRRKRRTRRRSGVELT